jgi:predicted GTPase
MSVKIALAGNPNSGKTTLFNFLTGANQYVGNWPGVTVEKKEHSIKKHFLNNNESVVVVDLPGAYSMSPFTSEDMETHFSPSIISTTRFKIAALLILFADWKKILPRRPLCFPSVSRIALYLSSSSVPLRVRISCHVHPAGIPLSRL